MKKRGRPPQPPPTLPDTQHRSRLVARHGLQSRLMLRALDTYADTDLHIGTRVERILAYLAQRPIKTDHDMLFIVMYDITDNKIRLHVAKYLLRKGCIRIQKSVFLGSHDRRVFKEIGDTLRDINAAYHNTDSIVLLPITTDIMSTMKLIGQNADIHMVTRTPNVLIF